MAQVTVTINGRSFRMGCEDGQEGHLTRLAKELDERIADIRGKFGGVVDPQLTIMAALTIADELSEATAKLRRLEEEIAGLQDARGVAAERAQATHDAVVAALNSASERLEDVAKKLNQTIGGPDAALG